MKHIPPCRWFMAFYLCRCDLSYRRGKTHALTEASHTGCPSGLFKSRGIQFVYNINTRENPLKYFLTVYPIGHALCAYAATALAREPSPASDWLLPPRFPSELQDTDIALHCSKMAAVIQNPLKA